tara:strand:- start:1936 stop:2532 length:597 start_codon:yes stop_codon:yes gene_type:complete
MALNTPVGSTNNISFGPGKIKLGKWEDLTAYSPSTIDITPTTDVGYIGEDGITLELNSEKRIITQGNPAIATYSFAIAQSAMINFTSIEWDFENFVYALGAGVTTATAALSQTFGFGGNPLNTECAILIEHEMASSGDSLEIYAWKCQSESGFSIPLTAQEEHKFEFGFTVLNSTQDWLANTLGATESLIRIKRNFVS